MYNLPSFQNFWNGRWTELNKTCWPSQKFFVNYKDQVNLWKNSVMAKKFWYFLEIARNKNLPTIKSTNSCCFLVRENYTDPLTVCLKHITVKEVLGLFFSHWAIQLDFNFLVNFVRLYSQLIFYLRIAQQLARNAHCADDFLNSNNNRSQRYRKN